MKKNRKNENEINQNRPPVPPFPFFDPDEESRKNLPSEAPKFDEEIPPSITEKNVDGELKIEIDYNLPEPPPKEGPGRDVFTFRDKLKFILVVFVIIATVVAGAMILYDRLSGKNQGSQNNSSVKDKNISVAFSEEEISIRSDWSSSKSLVYLAKTSSSGYGFELEKVFLCDSSLTESEIPQQTELVSDLSRSVSPITFFAPNYETIGINDGWDYAVNIYMKSHPFKEKDIGSVYRDEAKVKFTIVKIVDENNFLLYPSYTDYVGANFKFAMPKGTTLNYVSGKSTVKTVKFGQAKQTQLYPYYNNASCEITADSKMLDVSKPGSVVCSDLRVKVSFDVLNIGSCLKYIQLNEQENNNSSFYSDAISDKYMRITYTYSFDQNGSCTLKTNIEAKSDINFSLIGGFDLTAQKINDLEYIYVPNSTDFSVLGAAVSKNEYLTPDKWSNSLLAPYRVYSFLNSDLSKGVCVGFCPDVSNSSNTTRKKLVNTSVRFDFEKSLISPFALSKEAALKRGQKFEVTSFIVPFEKNTYNFTDEDLTAMCWYRVNGDVYLMLDSHKPIDKNIQLPEFMKKMRVTPVDVYENTTVLSSDTDDGTIHIAVSSDYGYAVVKLTNK